MSKKLLLLPLLALCLTSCIFPQDGDKTPLGWCIWEIQKHEGYEDCAYTYQDVYAKDMQEEASMGGRVYAYIVTTYIYPTRTEWFCFIECKKTDKKYLNSSDVLLIDCDVIWEADYD